MDKAAKIPALRTSVLVRETLDTNGRVLFSTEWSGKGSQRRGPMNRELRRVVRELVGSMDGETVETVADFMFLSSKITADGGCSHEIKRHLLLGSKVMTKLDSILKSRDITWPTKVHLVKAMVYPVVMYGCESWTIRKAEH